MCRTYKANPDEDITENAPIFKTCVECKVRVCECNYARYGEKVAELFCAKCSSFYCPNCSEGRMVDCCGLMMGKPLTSLKPGKMSLHRTPTYFCKGTCIKECTRMVENNVFNKLKLGYGSTSGSTSGSGSGLETSHIPYHPLDDPRSFCDDHFDEELNVCYSCAVELTCKE